MLSVIPGTSNKKPICSGHKGESLTPSGSTLFDNRTQSLIDFTTRIIDSNFFGEFDFVECLRFIKLFHSKQFDLVWKPCTFNDMPKEKILANGGELTEEGHVNQ